MDGQVRFIKYSVNVVDVGLLLNFAVESSTMVCYLVRHLVVFFGSELAGTAAECVTVIQFSWSRLYSITDPADLTVGLAWGAARTKSRPVQTLGAFEIQLRLA